MTSTGDVVLVLVAGLASVVVAMAAAAVRARQLGKAAVVDVAWGAGFVLVALVSAVVGQLVAPGGTAEGVRRWVVVALVAAWGLRLAWHVRGRALGDHQGKEDPRYEALLGGSLDEVGMAVAVRKVFLTQGLAMWLVSLPVMVGAVVSASWWALVPVGVVVWGVGLAFEAVGDAQLAAYKRDPDRPTVMARGLWAWTRHPNYFGDACLWWGLWLAGGLASGWLAGLLTVVAPVAMTYFIRNVTGAKLLEQTMSRREGWDEYVARVPLFFPRPPRRRDPRSSGGVGA